MDGNGFQFKRPKSIHHQMSEPEKIGHFLVISWVAATGLWPCHLKLIGSWGAKSSDHPSLEHWMFDEQTQNPL